MGLLGRPDLSPNNHRNHKNNLLGIGVCAAVPALGMGLLGWHPAPLLAAAALHEGELLLLGGRAACPLPRRGPAVAGLHKAEEGYVSRCKHICIYNLGIVWNGFWGSVFGQLQMKSP